MANDFFKFKQFTVHHDRCGMKVGTDGTLLGAWARGGNRILDIGTGSGLIALMMAQRFPKALVTGIDIDGIAAGQAMENVAASPFHGRIDIICQDVIQLPASVQDGHDSYDAIVSNPPYFADSLCSPDGQRTLARHAATLTYRTLASCCRRLLAERGELSVVIPADQKGRMEAEATLAGFFKSRECAVKTSPQKPPKRWLLAFRKHPDRTEHTELTIGSEEYMELTKDFYL
jgi:tRNA1Val (adenine37-N6)-methyltransferase